MTGRDVDRSPVGPAVHGAQELLTLLASSVADDAMLALDLDGRVCTWNPGAERLEGYRADEIIGVHFSRLYPDKDVAAGKPDRDLAIATADGQYYDEGWRERRDGSPFWASTLITALRGADGRLVGFGWVTRDLTARKRGEDALIESEERFRLLVDGVGDYAIYLLDGDGFVKSWNLGAERLKGYRADEILGRHFSTFYTEADRRAGIPAAALREALEAGRWESEGWRVRKDGSQFWANVVITALRNSSGVFRGYAKVTRDLTERKRNEDALRGILERERETSRRLRELDHSRTELVAMIAHDLRAPVGVIQSLLQLVATQWSTMTDPDKLAMLERAADRTRKLASLVDDVFDLARIDAGELQVLREPVAIDRLLAELIADLGHPASARVTVRGPTGVDAIGDERRTWQVLTNLLSNALKFSPPDSPVSVSVDRGDGEVVIAVADQGAGISVEDQPRIFDRFTRLPGNTHAPGSGIGLFIAKSLAEAQAGELTVESVPGEGSTFRLTLPAPR